MLIGGLQKFTALDYPGKIAATVFTVGCNFRCPYCHNAEIVTGRPEAGLIEEEEVLEFLRTRVGELDGVCVTGGEPTLHGDLGLFIEKIKRLGFLVKLDTNGSNLEMVRQLLAAKLVDYFAIDVKTAFHKYHLVAAPASAEERTLESIRLIIESGVPLELRTTVAPGVVRAEDFDDIVAALDAKHDGILAHLYRYSVQAFRPQKCLDKEFEALTPYEDEVLDEIADRLRHRVKRVDVLK